MTKQDTDFIAGTICNLPDDLHQFGEIPLYDRIARHFADALATTPGFDRDAFLRTCEGAGDD